MGAVVLSCLWPAFNPLVRAECAAPPELQAKIGAAPTAEDYSSLGAWFANQKNFSCAATEYAAALRRQPQSAFYAYLWGLSLHLDGDEKGALSALKKAKQLDANDIRPHLVLGAVYDKLKQPAESEAEYRAALAIDPGSAVALDSLSQEFIDRKDYASVVALLDEPGSGRMRTPAQSLNLGIALAASARLDAATRVLRDGLRDSPDSLAIADELAVVLMLMGSEMDADTLLDSVLARHPEDRTTQVLYLRILVSSHNEKAEKLADKLIAMYPDSSEVQYSKGVLEMRAGDFASARGFFERSIALNPDDGHSHADLGSTLAKLGDLAGAKAQFEQALEHGDNEVEVHYGLARVLLRMGDKTEAEAHLKISREVEGAESGRMQAAQIAQQGAQAMSQGDAVRAVSLYREAIDSDPGAAILYYDLSQALDKQHDLAGERTALEKAIAIDPNLAEAQNQMGYLALHAGDMARAETYFRAAVQASPSYVRGWINLAATLTAEEKWSDARQAIRHVLEVDPQNSQARELDQMLSDAHPEP